MKFFVKIHFFFIFFWGGGSGRGGGGYVRGRSQGGCEQNIEVFVKIQKKNGGSAGGSGGGRGRVGGTGWM